MALPDNRTSCRLVWMIAVLLILQQVWAEEAVEPSGRRVRGTLMQKQGSWLFQDEQGKELAVNRLAYVRFEPKAGLLPRTPLIVTLLLPHQQRLTGSLVRVDEKTLEFTTCWGGSYVLHRAQLVGVVQANDWMPIVNDRFADSLSAWKCEGKPVLDPKMLLFGKSALKLDAPGQQLTREWKPIQLDSRVSFFVRRSKDTGSLRCSIEPSFSDGRTTQIPALVIDKAGFRCANVGDRYGMLEASSDWQSVVLERQGEVLRFYVDDLCLGQSPIARDAGIKGVRVSTMNADARGGLWIDACVVAQRLPAMPFPRNETEHDFVWLIHGEQLFGRIVSSDANGAVLDAKFGKRSFPWRQLRGIGFANSKADPARSDVEIEFRPGSGFAADCLHARLIRWHEANLIVDHALLGELTIERDRLEKIRFLVK